MKEINEGFFEQLSNRTQKSKTTIFNENDSTKEKNKKNKNIIEDYIIKETLGKGTFSVVKLGEQEKTKQKVAIKILDKEKIKTKEDLTRIQREIKILSMLEHPNIIKTYTISETPKKYYIIMEYCEGGELFDYIVEKERLKESEASIFFYQLINALEYIHSKGIAHRDLKPENLLLSQNKKSIKIIDFGLSNFFENGNNCLETPCGSPSYASPEIIRGEVYDGFKIDIWACGIILFAMLCGYLPFDDDEEEEKEEQDDKKYFSQSNINKEEKSEDNEVLFQKILDGKIDFPDYLSDMAIDLIQKMLVVKPDDRIEISDIKKHKFYLTGKKNSLLYQKNVTEHELFNNLNLYMNGINNNNNNNIINISDNSNSNLVDKDKIVVNISGINSLDVSMINPKKDNNNEKNDNNINNDKKEIKIKENKNDMEEYEKKLFANYLKKVADVKKKNNEVTKNKNKNKKDNKKNLYINIMSSMNNNSHNYKKYSKYKNNYTLNEIVLNFNPINNPNESYKQILTTPSIQKYNYNNNYEHKLNNNVPVIKLNPIKLKKLEKNNFNILYQNINSLNTIDFMLKKENKTKNKFLKEINHYLLNNNHNLHPEEQKDNINKYPRISMSQRYKKNKQILPIIKTNNIIGNNKYDGKIFLSNNHLNNHVLTEANNKSTRNKIIFNWNNKDKDGYVDFRNNIRKSFGNNIYKDKYKFSYPNNYKKYNISIFNGAY